MENIYKIFFDDASLHLVPNTQISDYKNSGFYEFKAILNDSEKILPDNFLDNTDGHYIIACQDTQTTFKNLKSKFKYIEAAGGLVFNENNELLIIYRREKYDLPKGKKEKNENIPTTAIREVEEECGISNIKIIKELPSTYHIYFHKEKYILKKTYWYKMETHKQKLIPQTEEEITHAEWLPLNEISKFKANTFSTLLELLQAENL